MPIQTISIKNFRNLHPQEHSFSPAFNILIGHNGAGKTSVLEAMYLMGTGRSFRAHNLDKLIQEGATGFSITLQLTQPTQTDLLDSLPLRVSKYAHQPAQYYIGENRIQSIAEITQLLPLQLITQESYRLLDDGPEMRRKFLDQGLFYSDLEFLPLWRRCMHALKQRNAALKTYQSLIEIEVWEAEFANMAAQLSERRKKFIEQFKPVWLQLLQDFLTIQDVNLELKRGWPEQQDLQMGLQQCREYDKQRGFTGIGPHRADLMFSCRGKPARDVLSRGQKKLLIYSLCLAQTVLLRQQKQVNFVYLIDEMPAELDVAHRKRVVERLIELDAQIFMTGTEMNEAMFPVSILEQMKMFHVEQGVIR